MGAMVPTLMQTQFTNGTMAQSERDNLVQRMLQPIQQHGTDGIGLSPLMKLLGGGGAEVCFSVFRSFKTHLFSLSSHKLVVKAISCLR